MNAEVAPSIDIFSTERAGLCEHLECLNGRTTWREPHTYGSRGSRIDNTPHEHSLEAAISYARRCNPNDIGPDILESLVFRRIVHGLEIRTQLVRALRDMSRIVARADILQVRDACAVVIAESVTGLEADRPKGVKEDAWKVISTLGVRLLWASAAATIRRTAESS